jgi:hypothetical protein
MDNAYQLIVDKLALWNTHLIKLLANIAPAALILIVAFYRNVGQKCLREIDT